MSDLADMLLEAEQEAAAEAEERQVVASQLAELSTKIAELSAAIERLAQLAAVKAGARKVSVTVTGRDENDRIKSFTVN